LRSPLLIIIVVSVLMLSLIVLPSQSAFGWGGGGGGGGGGAFNVLRFGWYHGFTRLTWRVGAPQLCSYY